MGIDMTTRVVRTSGLVNIASSRLIVSSLKEFRKSSGKVIGRSQHVRSVRSISMAVYHPGMRPAMLTGYCRLDDSNCRQTFARLLTFTEVWPHRTSAAQFLSCSCLADLSPTPQFPSDEWSRWKLRDAEVVCYLAATVEACNGLPVDGVGPCSPQFSNGATAKVLAIVGSGAVSPLGVALWEEVMQHMARRLRWIDDKLEMLVISDQLGDDVHYKQDVQIAIQNSSILVIVGVQNETHISWLKELDGMVPTQICFDSGAGLNTWLGGMRMESESALEKFAAVFQGSKVAEHRKTFQLVSESWNRKSSDSISFALLALIDSYVTPVKSLKSLRATSFASLKCIVNNCGPQLVACMLDPSCRKALDCLSNCGPTDQICSYRCIVSYESPQFEDFALCVLQRNNCLGLSADILMQPNVQPMPSFRGQALTHCLGEDLFIGWLGKHKWSWRVAAGQNAAYDHFPCQYQLFYRGKARGSMWYDPVFQVKTLDGQTVWRRRHYRVKRSETPGTFYFTVLDSGVVSKEFWRIVHVEDDFSWALFYYSGAAAVAGQSYTGAVLCTPDGKWPKETQQSKVSEALESCGIKVWELYTVDNSCCADIPFMNLPEGASLHSSECFG